MDWSGVDFSWFISIISCLVLVCAGFYLWERSRLKYDSKGDPIAIRVQFDEGGKKWLDVSRYCPATPTSHDGWMCTDFNAKMYFVASNGDVYLSHRYTPFGRENIIGIAPGILAAHRRAETLVRY